eukprot:gene10365-biopygen11067
MGREQLTNDLPVRYVAVRSATVLLGTQIQGTGSEPLQEGPALPLRRRRRRPQAERPSARAAPTWGSHKIDSAAPARRGGVQRGGDPFERGRRGAAAPLTLPYNTPATTKAEASGLATVYGGCWVGAAVQGEGGNGGAPNLARAKESQLRAAQRRNSAQPDAAEAQAVMNRGTRRLTATARRRGGGDATPARQFERPGGRRAGSNMQQWVIRNPAQNHTVRACARREKCRQ